MSSQQFVHIAGWSSCGFYRKATNVLASLAVLFPQRIKVINHEFPSRSEYRAWLIEKGFRGQFSEVRAHTHSSSPFTWMAGSEKEEDIDSYLGGCDDTLAWCRKFCGPMTSSGPIADMKKDDHASGHGYEYDLVVIGGGSGGLAASKEASSLGAKVAVLDFVKPSPHGTAWGLGGTCVNVGCIPKKLMHYGSIVNEAMHFDSAPFGISAKPSTAHNWEEMRTNIQNHIRGLNFKYRVNLREKDVTYLNKLGRFIDPHTLELTDKKGNKSTLTSSRFIIATGGRPTPLSCPGAELAISSDDIFALESDPGKVLCVGASYISLECAGFLKGLGHDVTVAVRSILLRGFDRECAELIGSYMEQHGVHFKREVVPTLLEKVQVNGSQKIRVVFTDNSEDTYDTVLVAVGRTADTEKLGLENVNIKTNPKGKIPTKFEQTACPNIYAIGDVMENCPELTPVAIQAGVHLARRLFSGSKEPMDYRNICTTVFTPIEYSTVGYSEDAAIETFGAENIDVYHKFFGVLEWSLAEQRDFQAFCKVVVNKSENEKVLGIHYVGPNAGEVMQGFGVAVKKGIVFEDLKETVGIHPTTAEELVTLTVTKASGGNAKAGGC